MGAGSSVAGLGRLDVTLCTGETSRGFQGEGIHVGLRKKPNMPMNGIVEAGRWGGRQEAGVEERRQGWRTGGWGGKEEAAWRRMGWRPRHQSEGPGKDRNVYHITVLMKHNV